MRSARGHFEVRCSNCDVSFAVGTKKCIHCGGRTHASPETGAPVVKPGEFGFEGVESQIGGGQAVEPEADRLESMLRRSGLGGASEVEGRLADDDMEEVFPTEETSSPGRSLLSTFGSLIWIAMLILFSMTGRTCGGE